MVELVDARNDEGDPKFRLGQNVGFRVVDDSIESFRQRDRKHTGLYLLV